MNVGQQFFTIGSPAKDKDGTFRWMVWEKTKPNAMTLIKQGANVHASRESAERVIRILRPDLRHLSEHPDRPGPH